MKPEMKKTLILIAAVIFTASCGTTRMLQKDITDIRTEIGELKRENQEMKSIIGMKDNTIDSLKTYIEETRTEMAELSDRIASMNAMISVLLSRNPAGTISEAEDMDIQRFSIGGCTFTGSTAKQTASKPAQPREKKAAAAPAAQRKALDPNKCQATGKNGGQCQLPPMPGSKFCEEHQQL